MDGAARYAGKSYSGGNMKAEDILLKHPRFRVGYIPQSVAQSKLTLKDIREMCYRRLKKIPSKIAVYFDRSKLIAVFKSDHMSHQEDNYYLLQTVDGTIFHVEF